MEISFLLLAYKKIPAALVLYIGQWFVIVLHEVRTPR